MPLFFKYDPRPELVRYFAQSVNGDGLPPYTEYRLDPDGWVLIEGKPFTDRRLSQEVAMNEIQETELPVPFTL